MDDQTLDHNPRQSLDEVLELISQLAHKSDGGKYVYRGEREIYEKVSSTLYRRYEGIDAEGSGIEAIQREIISQSRAHAPFLPEVEDFDLLAQLRHNGGEVNLIDFTTDFLVALFFACDGEPAKAGRVVLLPEKGEGYYTEGPISPAHRVIAQKSVFVRPDKGFVEPADAVFIDSRLKPAILDYLRRHHGISTETIYNDLYGFILHQDVHRRAYTELYEGVTLADKGSYQQAIEHFTNAIRLNPELGTAYNNRGSAYHDLGEYETAIADYLDALSFDPENSAIYNNLGVAYAALGDLQEAIEHFSQALELNPDDHTRYYRFEAWLRLADWDRAKQELRFAALGLVDIAALFRSYYQNVNEFQVTNGIQLPEDIAELLG